MVLAQKGGLNVSDRPQLPAIASRRACLAKWLVGAVACATIDWVSVGEARGGAALWPYERQLGHVTLHADFSLNAQPALLDEIGTLHEQVNLVLGLPAPREPVHVILFKQKTTYQAYLKQYYPRVPYRRALYIKDRGPGTVYAFRSSELEVDLRHETTHALLHSAVGAVPLWLDEGLAEYFEVPALQRAGGHEYLAAIRGQVRAGSLTRIEELETLDELTEMGAVEYQRAWAWTHFCLHYSVDTHDELRRYLADMAGGDEGPALSDRLRRRWPDLETKFVRHFRGWH